jgi:hypothetical protein
MAPETVRELLIVSLTDLARADELIVGVDRRRRAAIAEVTNSPHLYNDDAFSVATRLARQSIEAIVHEQKKILRSQTAYLRTTHDVTEQYERELRAEAPEPDPDPEFEPGSFDAY